MSHDSSKSGETLTSDILKGVEGHLQDRLNVRAPGIAPPEVKVGSAAENLGALPKVTIADEALEHRAQVISHLYEHVNPNGPDPLGGQIERLFANPDLAATRTRVDELVRMRTGKYEGILPRAEDPSNPALKFAVSDIDFQPEWQAGVIARQVSEGHSIADTYSFLTPGLEGREQLWHLMRDAGKKKILPPSCLIRSTIAPTQILTCKPR